MKIGLNDTESVTEMKQVINGGDYRCNNKQQAQETKVHRGQILHQKRIFDSVFAVKNRWFYPSFTYCEHAKGYDKCNRGKQCARYA